MSGEATNEIYIYEIKAIFMTKNRISLYCVHFLCMADFALKDIIHVHTLHHIDDDVA